MFSIPKLINFSAAPVHLGVLSGGKPLHDRLQDHCLSSEQLLI